MIGLFPFPFECLYDMRVVFPPSLLPREMKGHGGYLVDSGVFAQCVCPIPGKVMIS